jgi:hypothetical protein
MSKVKATLTSGKSVSPKHVTYVKNRERTLINHLKTFPNDKVALVALDNGTYKSYRRKTPKTTMWSKQDIAAVKLYIMAGRTGKDFLADKMKAKKSPVSLSRKATNA